MKNVNFNADWKFRRLQSEDKWQSVTVPHDAMIFENRTADADGGTNTGWYEGHDYEYLKTFDVPADYAEKIITFEFEGVYHNAEVYINGVKAAYRPYGYTNFYVEANGFLKFGEENEIKVIAHNADQPNSRWYSGAGIYRPVTMWVAEKKHIVMNGVKIRTLQTDPAVVEVRVQTSEAGEAEAEIYYRGKVVAADKKHTENDCVAVFALEINNADLWSPDNPALYTCRVKFGEDEREEIFGIRTIACTPSEGFTMNGRRVIIRGACIHHDNGILGARCYEEAEERKIRILKENGYNAVRSAHKVGEKEEFSMLQPVYTFPSPPRSAAPTKKSE